MVSTEGRSGMAFLLVLRTAESGVDMGGVLGVDCSLLLFFLKKLPLFPFGLIDVVSPSFFLARFNFTIVN